MDIEQAPARALRPPDMKRETNIVGAAQQPAFIAVFAIQHGRFLLICGGSEARSSGLFRIRIVRCWPEPTHRKCGVSLEIFNKYRRRNSNVTILPNIDQDIDG
jgi:hypothetical protein